MPFTSGSVSFRRFRVIGSSPTQVSQEHIDALKSQAFTPTEFGVPPATEYGWVGGRHVLDAEFSFDANVFHDCLHVAMRVDTNKYPPALKEALLLSEEAAAAKGNPSGFISKSQKRQAKDAVAKKVDEELRTGKYRRSKMVPVLWDVAADVLYAAVSDSAAELLRKLFTKTFHLDLSPIDPTAMASDYAGKAVAGLRPTSFAHSPEGLFANYPWAGGESNWLGNEFLLWLWHESEATGGRIEDDGVVTEVFIDRALTIECAYGTSGRDQIKATGPGRSPEAREGLRIGKVPRSAGLMLERFKQSYTLTLTGDTLAVASARLPDVEGADSPRTVFEERIVQVRDLCKAIDSLFRTFLRIRCNANAWADEAEKILVWVQAGSVVNKAAGKLAAAGLRVAGVDPVDATITLAKAVGQ